VLVKYIEYNENGKHFQYSANWSKIIEYQIPRRVNFHFKIKNGRDTGITLQSCYTNSKIGAVHTDKLLERNVPTPLVYVKAM